MKLTEKQVKDLEQVWFENFLKDKHYDLHQGILDDDLSDHYDNWIANLSVEDIYKYAREHHYMLAGWTASDFIERNY